MTKRPAGGANGQGLETRQAQPSRWRPRDCLIWLHVIAVIVCTGIHELMNTSIKMNMHKHMRTAKHKRRFELPLRFTHSRPMTRQWHHDFGWTLHRGGLGMVGTEDF